MSSASIRQCRRSRRRSRTRTSSRSRITRVGPFPPRMSNVGVVIDLAVHDIDLIRWFTDSEIVEVQPQLSSAVAEREDIALLQFRTASGVLAHINTNWLTPFKARTVHVATRRKYLIGDLLTRQVTECFGFQPDGSYSMRHLSVGHAEPLRAELQSFVSAIRENKTPPVTGEEGVESLDIAMRCLEDRQPSKVVTQSSRATPRRRLIFPSLEPARPRDRDESARPRRTASDSVHRRGGAAKEARQGDRRGDDACPESLPVSDGAGGCGLRTATGGVLRRQARAVMFERHRRAGDDPDGEGHRTRRCSVLSDLHLLRDRGESRRFSVPRRFSSTSTPTPSTSTRRA